MASVINLKRGLDICLYGKAQRETLSTSIVQTIYIDPSDFQGLTPKVLVKVGETLQVGTPVLCDKIHPEIVIVSPVNGVVERVERGERRKLLHVVVRPDFTILEKPISAKNPLTLTSEEVKDKLLQSGIWPYLLQRPYSVIPNPDIKPRDIFVSGFDTAPLSADVSYLLEGHGADFQTGLDALTRLTEGSVFLSIPSETACKELVDAKSVDIRLFKGPHPAGNVGVQINNIKPVNKGEVVWALHVPEVLYIGRLFRQGRIDFKRLVAVCGPGVRKPSYCNVLPGTPISALLNGNVFSEMHARIVSGNPLTGKQVMPDGFLTADSTSITVLKEGDDTHEFFGWIMPRIDKFSMSRTYLSGFISKLFPVMRYEFDTRLMGGRRALIESGQYEKVFPMDILPEQLVRACITGNIEKQENLGIYEVAPEDFALCEYVCTSKVEVQKAVRNALDVLRAENGD